MTKSHVRGIRITAPPYTADTSRRALSPAILAPVRSSVIPPKTQATLPPRKSWSVITRRVPVKTLTSLMVLPPVEEES